MSMEMDPGLPPERPTATPSADDVRAYFRGQNIRVTGLAAILVVFGLLTVWFSASSRAASEDSFNATEVAFDVQAREDCILQRRNLELEATGDAVAALGRAQIAGFFSDDDAEVRRQSDAFEEALERLDAAQVSLTPNNLDRPPPLGCGPPITSQAIVSDADE